MGQDSLATPISVPPPLPLVDKVKHEIERTASAGVIEAVDEPTDWCAPIVVVPKQSGDVRICVDLTKLNEAVRRENYIIPKVEITLGSIGSKRHIYTKLDANTERRCAQIEKEALATTWELYHFADLLIGMHFRPPAIGSSAIHKATRRTSYTHTAFPDAAHEVLVLHRTYVPGKYPYTADALSAAPLSGIIDRGSEEFQREVNFYVNAVLVQLAASDQILE